VNVAFPAATQLPLLAPPGLHEHIFEMAGDVGADIRPPKRGAPI
jgi:hypothetical protein